MSKKELAALSLCFVFHFFFFFHTHLRKAGEKLERKREGKSALGVFSSNLHSQSEKEGN